jgi:hypothetical protein
MTLTYCNLGTDSLNWSENTVLENKVAIEMAVCFYRHLSLFGAAKCLTVSSYTWTCWWFCLGCTSGPHPHCTMTQLWILSGKLQPLFMHVIFLEWSFIFLSSWGPLSFWKLWEKAEGWTRGMHRPVFDPQLWSAHVTVSPHILVMILCAEASSTGVVWNICSLLQAYGLSVVHTSFV